MENTAQNIDYSDGLFTVAIVGRPNVGKSTLFNCLAGKQLAIVDDTPGVTRDWREAPATLTLHDEDNDKQKAEVPIRILDTAGLEDAFDDSIPGRMRVQTQQALDQAHVLVFVIDGREGLTPGDEHFAEFLRKQKRPILLAVNKCENDKVVQSAIGESYSLGLGTPIALSAAHGGGLDDLYQYLEQHCAEYYAQNADALSSEDDGDSNATIDEEALDAIEGNQDFEMDEGAGEEEKEDATKPLKIAIVGRPNVGKSTLMNSLLEDQRVMTGPEAGITRDAIAVDWTYNERPMRLVDTAGMRKKARVQEKVETLSVGDTLRAIRLAQVVVLVIDANMPFEKQDLQIADHIIEEGRAMVIALNKWDTVEDKKETLANVEYKLTRSLAQVKNVPVVTISALMGKNLGGMMDQLLKIYNVWNRRAATGNLNRWLSAKESQHPPPLISGRPNRLKYIAQIKSRPPTFALWVSQPKKLPKDYKRYIINALREDFDIPGVPIRLLVRTSKNPYGK